MLLLFLSSSPLLSIACAFILFYQELCSGLTFADAHARACSVCLLFVFISAAGIFQVGEQKKTGLASSLAPGRLGNKHVERERELQVLCARQSDTCRCVEENTSD